MKVIAAVLASEMAGSGATLLKILLVIFFSAVELARRRNLCCNAPS